MLLISIAYLIGRRSKFDRLVGFWQIPARPGQGHGGVAVGNRGYNIVLFHNLARVFQFNVKFESGFKLRSINGRLIVFIQNVGSVGQQKRININDHIFSSLSADQIAVLSPVGLDLLRQIQHLGPGGGRRVIAVLRENIHVVKHQLHVSVEGNAVNIAVVVNADFRNLLDKIIIQLAAQLT